MVRARLLAAIVITLFARTAGATLTVGIGQPQANAGVGDLVTVIASVGSAYQVTSVQAQAGSASATLAPSGNNTFTGMLDLSGLTLGPVTVTVTATNVVGDTGSAQVTLAHDHPPSVTVTDPLPGTVARPSFHLAASCVQAGPYPCTLSGYLHSPTTGTMMTFFSSSTNTVDQVETLSGYEGQMLNAYIVATDSAGMSTSSAAIPLYFDNSPRLIELETVPGPILDVDSTRVLYSMGIHTRGTSTNVALPSQLGNDCRLSPNGALCNGGEWRNGSVVATWPFTPGPSGYGVEYPLFAARGNYAASVFYGNNNSVIYYRDAVAGMTSQIASNPGAEIAADDVATNGDVIISEHTTPNTWHVYRYRAGVVTDLTPTGPGQLGNEKYGYAHTDGINVIYQQWYLGIGGVGTFMHLSDDSLLTLVPNNQGCNSISADTHAVNGGWTAYGSPDSACAVQVWLRAPDDTRTQTSVWSTDSTVDAVSDNGEVMMLNSSPLGSFRYHASRGVFPDAVNSQLGRAIWVDNQWYIIMGRTLFAIAGLSPPDGGTGGSDGSTMTPDAGTTPDAPAGTTPDAPAGTPSDAPAGTIPDAPGGTPPDAPGGTPPDAPAPIDASGAGGSANAPTQDSGCSVVLGTPTASSFSFFVVAVVLASRRYRRRSSHRT